MSDAQPFTKEMQLARGERRHHRKVASPKRWQAIIEAKRGPCRVCGSTGPVEYHHLVARSAGGGDIESNITPLCAEHHRLVTNRDYETCRVLATKLEDDEYAYIIGKLGESGPGRLFGIWEKT